MYFECGQSFVCKVALIINLDGLVDQLHSCFYILTRLHHQQTAKHFTTSRRPMIKQSKHYYIMRRNTVPLINVRTKEHLRVRVRTCSPPLPDVFSNKANTITKSVEIRFKKKVRSISCSIIPIRTVRMLAGLHPYGTKTSVVFSLRIEASHPPFVNIVDGVVWLQRDGLVELLCSSVKSLVLL